MADFKVLGPHPRRSFKLTVGLDPGYSHGTGAATDTTYEIRYRQAGEAIRGWLASQSSSGRPFLNGTLTRGLCLYTRPVGPRGPGRAYADEVAVFEGEVSPVHLAATPDAEIEFALLDLARYLCDKCEQVRVYAAYRDQVWVVQHGDMPV